MEELKTSYYEDGKQRLFDQLQIYLIPDGNVASYAQTAVELDLSETAVKVAIHRLRQKFGKSLRAIVMQTLNDPADLEEEVNSLLESLA